MNKTNMNNAENINIKEHTDNQPNEQVLGFFAIVKKQREQAFPPKDLLTVTLHRLYVTKDYSTRTSFVTNLHNLFILFGKAVNNLSINNKTMNKPWIYTIPFGVAAVLAIVLLVAKPYQTKQAKLTTQGSKPVVAENIKSSDSVDTIANAVLGTATDIDVALSNDEGVEAGAFDKEVFNAYTEQYENSNL